MEAPVPLELKRLPAISQDHATELRNRGFCVVKGLLNEALLDEAVRLSFFLVVETTKIEKRLCLLSWNVCT